MLTPPFGPSLCVEMALPLFCKRLLNNFCFQSLIGIFMPSGYIFFKRRFSSTSSFIRFISETSIPPNFARHLYPKGRLRARSWRYSYRAPDKEPVLACHIRLASESIESGYHCISMFSFENLLRSVYEKILLLTSAILGGDYHFIGPNYKL